MKGRRITIKQVARAAGVSTQTVSRVLNNRPDVASDTRQRIQTIIENLGYRPSAVARSLIQQRSDMLGVVTAGLKYIGPSRTLNGITDQAERMGYSLLLKELSRFDLNNLEPLFDALHAHQVDGILWAVPEVGDNRAWVDDRLFELSVPIVFIQMKVRPGLNIVSFDQLQGGLLATQHLIQQGRRRIGHISGPLDWWEARERRKGWQLALHEVGIEALEKHCTEGNWSSASGERAMLQLMQQYPQMDSVFVANDQMALSAILCAQRAGRRVPEDLAIVGFDGLPEAAYYSPPLTTIDQNQYELGCSAVRLLIELIKSSHNGEPTEPTTIVLAPRLIRRESSAVEGESN